MLGKLPSEVRQISTADYDGDGHTDIYLAAHDGSSWTPPSTEFLRGLRGEC